MKSTVLIFCAATSLLIIACARTDAVEFSTVTHLGKRSTICTVDLNRERLELFLNDAEGHGLRDFRSVEKWQGAIGRRLIFGMNAGMYHPGFAPVGLFITGGRELAPLNLDKGEGNFFLKPNGVFVVTAAGNASVIDAAHYSEQGAKVELATQSGPLLVIDGSLHPAFNADSVSRLFRNGVGVQSAKRVVFAISAEPVNLYEFATLFRDALRCKNALFLDGTISSLHAPALKRSDAFFPLGPIIGVTEKRE